MKNLFFLLSASLPLFLFAQADPMTPASAFGKEFAPIWERATAYTLEVAEAMPEELYSFSAGGEVMSFEEQLVHITGNLYSLCSRFAAESEAPKRPAKAEEQSKAEIIAGLQEAFAYVSTHLHALSDEEMAKAAPKFWAGEETHKSGIFLLMRDHMTHHRAQLILYLRMKEIQPPRYRGW